MKRMIVSLIAVIFTVGALQASEGATHEMKTNSEVKKPYPLKTCIVSGEALGGSMGEPYVFKYKDEEIRLCCKMCKKDFLKEPAKYLAKLKKAKAAMTMKGGAHAEHSAHNVPKSDPGTQSEVYSGHDQHSGHGH